jgi:general stress protein 26
MAQLSPEELTHKFWEELADHPVVLIGLTESDHHHVPMRAQLDKSAHGQIWFFTGRDHRIARGGRCHVGYISEGQELYASLRGSLTEEADTAVIDKHWSSTVAATYPGGRNDPNLIMLRFDIGDAEFWTDDPTLKGAFKLLAGMAVSPEEMGSHAEVTM